MAKRFTDTDLWDKEWFMLLIPKEKLLVKFIFDKCDVAGIWSPNWKLASMYIGEAVTEFDLQNFVTRLEFLPSGKIFVRDFITFQYGTLSETCRPHQKIIEILKKYDLYDRVSKGYLNSIQRGQEEDKDKEMEQDKDEGGVGETKFVVPEMQKIFVRHNPAYPASQDHDYHALQSISQFLSKLGNGPPDVLPLWEKISAHVASSAFYSTKSLKTIANQIQNIYQEVLNPPKNGNRSQPGITNKNAGAVDLLDRLKKARIPNTG